MKSLFLLILIKLTSALISFQDSSSLGWDSDVRQFAGYIDVDDSQNSLFFWFFESRNDPANDPIILWTNGGPGCSAMKALWLIAPGIIQSDLSHIRNPYSWNSNASIIFLDQPAGTGLSTVTNDVTNLKSASQQVYEFINTFFESFPEYQGLDFHLIGQSDAGHLLADTSAELLSHNDRLVNLTSLVIGNGLINTQLQYQYIQPMLCGDGGIEQVLTTEQCQQMDLNTPICVDKIMKCNNYGLKCQEALEFCNNSTMNQLPGNYFNLKQPCDNLTATCYAQDTYYEMYMNLPYVLKTLGSRKSSFSNCNVTIANLFAGSGAQLASSEASLAAVLDEGIPLLIFAGDLDGTYNWLGSRAVAQTIAWEGQQQFTDSAPIKLLFNEQPIGELTTHNNLSFVRIFEAGHLVPHDKPKETLELINTWLSGDFSFMSLRGKVNETMEIEKPSNETVSERRSNETSELQENISEGLYETELY